jgi:DNA invertase Pin-like site-specific DNA recombinase
MIYGYVRVSSKEQNEDRQIIALNDLQIPEEQIFIDKQSGKDFNRKNYLDMLSKLQAGDLLYILSIDRLGRNYDEILNQWRLITTDKDVDIVVIDMPMLDTRGRHQGDLMGKVVADVVLQLLSFAAQKEYESIHIRQAQGIAAARAKGVRFGRPIKTPPENFAVLVKQWEHGELQFEDLLEKTGLKEATFYRRLREHRVMKKR